MADGSVHTQDSSQGEVTASPATVFIGKDYLFDFGIPTDMCDADEMQNIAFGLVKFAKATLRVACVRGDNDADLPNTFAEAVEGAAVLLELASGVQAAAAKMRGKAL